MSQFRNLVFEGGGVKGIAYAGAVRILERKGILQEIRRVAGASAGAITSALLAAGAKSDDVQEIVGHTDFRKFMDDSFGFLRDIKRFLKSYGWYEGDEFSNWLKKQLQALTGRPNLRFKDLQSDTKRFKELYVVGTNLSTQMEQLFCAEYTPDMPVWKAVRISMSIPLFFAAVKENSDILVDGGVTWNYPIDLFDDKMYKPAKKAEGKVTYTKYDEDHIYNKETLGFRVDTLDEIQAEKDSWRAPPRKIENIADYAAALLSFMLDMANKAHLHKNDWDRTVFIDALGVSATDFSLSDAQVAALVESGEKRTETYFEWFEDPNSKPAPLNRV